LPDHFDLYLLSIEKNPAFDFLLITDDTRTFDYPKNIRVIRMSFEKLKRMFQERFDFNISLEYSYKLCDYKPAFGYIFEEMIK